MLRRLRSSRDDGTRTFAAPREGPFHVEDLVESERRAGVELALIVVVGVVVCVLAIVYRLPEWLLDRLDPGRDLDTNGLLALLVVAPLGAVVFATRRYRDAIRAQRELTRLSLHDPLTGLPNRRYLRAVLPGATRHARRLNTRVGVLFVDLDGFKAVNDTWGHEVGDRLMRAVADRLAEGAGPDRFVARFAGDEFVVLDPAPAAPEQSERLARELVDLLEIPFEFGEDRIRISASVGIAFADPNSDVDEVLRDADTAMYAAKGTPRRVTVFDPTLRSRLTPANAERRLEQALEAGEFRLFYQPLVALESGRMVGVEALLRWAHPERGLLHPPDFLPALEDTGLIVPVGRWVVEEAARRARHWAEIAEPGGHPLRVTLNVSPRQLAQSDFVDLLRDVLTRTGADPAQLYVELTETALIADVHTIWHAVEGARTLGVGMALDDFGTGFSSLTHLRDFEPSLVKLDRSFVARMGHSPADDTILRHVVALARGLGITTLAEGITDADQVRRLLDFGCQLGQGFYFADPQPAPVIDALLERQARVHQVPTAPDPATVVSAVRRDVPRR
ncbi:MAG: bifunctional diguanylate cyclase/phosphodiesterase [Actinomyces sp.]|nr:MAG: bifunctional diguanylate cyclase/phosphodiesterase [Actinomyces sp.]